MSFHLLSLAAKRQFGSLRRKMLALMIADKASDDGSGIWASVPSLAAECDMSVRAVQLTLREFAAEGLIRETGRRECIKNGQRVGDTIVYEMVLEAIERLPKASPEEAGGKRKTRSSGAPLAPVNGVHPNGLAHSEGEALGVGGAPPAPVHVVRSSGAPRAPKPILRTYPSTPLDKSNGDMSPAVQRKAAVDAYNLAAKAHGWRKCGQISEERKRKLDAHLRARGGIAGWMRDVAAMEAERWMDASAARNGKHSSWRFSLSCMFQSNFRDRMDDFEAPQQTDPLAEERWACAKRREIGRWPGGFSEASVVSPVVRAEFPDLFANGRVA